MSLRRSPGRRSLRDIAEDPGRARQVGRLHRRPTCLSFTSIGWDEGDPAPYRPQGVVFGLIEA